MTVACWKTEDAEQKVNCLCLGTGRFLRSVLVPALNQAGLCPALIQTRGRSFLDFMEQQGSALYPVDTVQPSGDIVTDQVACYGAFSLGSAETKSATLDFLSTLQQDIQILGVGVTEAGLASSETQAMKDLKELLLHLKKRQSDKKICIVDMDNVPNNGDTIRSHLLGDHAEGDDRSFLENNVVCLNTMVDRITSARPDSNGLVPRAEPLPAKALVLLDEGNHLPAAFSSGTISGVVVRSTRQQLDADIALKLRVANGTHTAVAHAMALTQHLLTSDALSGPSAPMWMESYLESVVQDQILKASVPLYGKEESEAVWEDWKGRLAHPHFGLSSFFITQNGAAKAGIRWGPTVTNLIQSSSSITVGMVLAYAILVRWLTPYDRKESGIFVGWLDGTKSPTKTRGEGTSYADGLHYDLDKGWYEFKCACEIHGKAVSELLLELSSGDKQPEAFCSVLRDYLVAPSGGDLGPVQDTPGFRTLIQAIATLTARLVAGDGALAIMEEMQGKQGVFVEGFSTDCSVLVDGGDSNTRTLHYQSSPVPKESRLMESTVDVSCVSSVIKSEVASAHAIDIHTHLLPPTHGPLCLWGIDELLTYHYLVAEYFITAPADVSPEKFYSFTKQYQADLIWKALFLDRSPVSEACRGVLTTLKAMGLEESLRSLNKIREFYATYRDRGLEGAQDFAESIYQKAGVRYAIMTNIPFSQAEAQFWKPNRVEYPTRFRSALRVDPLLAGDRKTIEASLQAAGYPLTLEGARQYLRDWCDVMKPEYMMASTPHDFVLQEGTLAGIKNVGINEEAMKSPGAFATAASAETACPPQEEESPSLIDERSDFLSQVLMQVCQERDLPVALKIGAHRGVNAQLGSAGDGVVAFADAGVLARLCTRFPTVRFLATFLSRNNQHEACVLASKFRNLHIYGCWWFCNNPSMIREITQMRVEMLGSAFTAQHSDARVLDHLVYKWSHSRAVIASVLVEEYTKLIETGWKPTRAEIRRDVSRLFGGSYEEFLEKSFA